MRLAWQLAAAVVLLGLVAARAETPPNVNLRVALYADDGAAAAGSPQIKALLVLEHGFSLELVSAEDIREGCLDRFDVLIQPGGRGSKQAETLGPEGRAAIRRFVEQGGGYVGICAGAYLASAQYEWSLDLLDAKVIDREHWARGTGDVQLKLTPAGCAMFTDDDGLATIYYGQGPLLAPAGRDEIPDYELLAAYETEIAKNGAPKGVMKGTTAAARAPFGAGRVFCFSPHPEKTSGLEEYLRTAVRWAAGDERPAEAAAGAK